MVTLSCQAQLIHSMCRDLILCIAAPYNSRHVLLTLGVIDSGVAGQATWQQRPPRCHQGFEEGRRS